MGLLLIILLVLLIFSAVPAYPYSRSWGYYPAGSLVGLLVIVLIVMLLVGAF